MNRKKIIFMIVSTPVIDTLYVKHVKIMLHTFTPSREKSWCTRTRFHKEAKVNFGGWCTALGI